MIKNIYKILILLTFLFTGNNLLADILKKVEITGNKRISHETIKVYGDIQLNKNYEDEDINQVIKKLYGTNFFSNISTGFSGGVLTVNVKENPIIFTIEVQGEEAKKFKEQILKIISLKERSSFIENFVKSDTELIKNFLFLGNLGNRSNPATFNRAPLRGKKTKIKNRKEARGIDSHRP